METATLISRVTYFVDSYIGETYDVRLNMLILLSDTVLIMSIFNVSTILCVM